MSTQKQCIGIDCAKDELVVCYGRLSDGLQVKLQATSCFDNDKEGIQALVRWAERQAGGHPKAMFVVEATGVYHQQLAYALHERKLPLAVVLPDRANHFAKTMKVRTVTDQTASKALATMGLEKNLDQWRPPDPLFGQLKQLTRERGRLKDHMSRLKNQRHAIDRAVEGLKGSLRRIEQQLMLCNEQLRQVEQEIKALMASKQDLKQRFDYVTSICGVGKMTAATVLAEANGFIMTRSGAQLVSYAGYDVVNKQSGSSVRGKPHISKHGNAHIRRALYFPAITAVQHSPKLKQFYQRLYERHGVKMKAYTAVQRKLLILIYTMWTKQIPYDSEYSPNKEGQPQKATLTS